MMIIEYSSLTVYLWTIRTGHSKNRQDHWQVNHTNQTSESHDRTHTVESDHLSRRKQNKYKGLSRMICIGRAEKVRLFICNLRFSLFV